MKIILLIICIVYIANADTINLTKSEKEFIKNNPTIVLGSGETFEPYTIKNRDGTISGYDADIVKLINEKTGLNLKFKLGKWKDIQKLAKEKQLDGLATAVYTKEREKYFNGTKPYVSYTSLVVVNKNNPQKLFREKDLIGKKIAVQKGNVAQEKLAKKIEDIQIVYYDSFHQLLTAVVSNEVDFSIIDDAAFYLAKLIGVESLIEPAFSIGETYELSFLFRKDMPQLVGIVNKALNSISSKEYLAIRQEWFASSSFKKNYMFTSAQKEYLKNKKEIKLCTDPNWMPFSSLENGQYSGINADIYKLISEKLPIEIKPVQVKSWEESLSLAKERGCDIFDVAIKTPQREKYLNFTSTFIDIPLVIVTSLDKPFIYNYESIKGKEVAITKGYAFIELLRDKYPFFKIKEVDSIADGLKLVKQKKVYGYIGALPTVAHVLKKNYTEELKVAGRFDEKYSMGSAVRNDDKVLFDILQKVVSSIPPDRIQHILNKWINIKYEKAFDYDLFFKIMGVVLVILLFFIYKQYILKRQVRIELEKSRKKDNLIFQQNKMSSLGEMIGNIAHQWRQPLAQVSMIQNYTLSKLENEKDIDKDILVELKNAQSILQVMSNTIDSFQNIYQNKEDEKHIFYPFEEVEKVLLALNQSIYLDSIKVDKNLDKTLTLYGSSNIFLQIVLSIVQNSVYFLRVRNIKSPKIVITLKEEVKSIILTIQDNAQGIDEEVLPFIFDYGFSKREEEEASTGIGLYISKLMITEKYKGSIVAKNTKDGVCFKVSLPLYNQKRE